MLVAMSDLQDPNPVSVAPPSTGAAEMHDDAAPADWFEDGGHKTALGAWAGVAVVTYALMQLTGFFADWPFVALVAGAVGYFSVRGAAVAQRELKYRRENAQDAPPA